MSEKRKTLGLVLGAGGARGACHIGVIKVLEENGIPIDYIAGSSMGAVVGSCYASGMTVPEMEKAISKLKLSEIMDVNLRPIKAGGFFWGNKSSKIINRYLKVKTFEECKIPFCCVAVDLNKGQPYVFKSGKLIDGVRASLSIPGIFQPVKKDGMLLVDGCILCRLPIDAMDEFSPDVILLVDAIGENGGFIENPNIFQVLLRTFDILDWKNTKKVYKRGDVVVVPKFEGSQFAVKTIPGAIQAGEKAMALKVNRIKKLLGIKDEVSQDTNKEMESSSVNEKN